MNDSVPVVYTCGVLHIEGSEKKYLKAGYGVYWPHELGLGAGRRYHFYPVTLVRCQLQAIIDALQQVTVLSKPLLFFSFDASLKFIVYDYLRYF